MNTYCNDCKRCTGGAMRKSDVPGGDDHNRCWECEATLQHGIAQADDMIHQQQDRIAAIEAELATAKRMLEEAHKTNPCCMYCDVLEQRDEVKDRCEKMEELLRNLQNKARTFMMPSPYSDINELWGKIDAALAQCEGKP